MLRIVVVTIIALFTIAASDCSKTSSSQNSVADEIIDAYAGSCQLGPWTKAALDRATELTSVFESLREKASCKDSPNLTYAIHSATLLKQELVAINQSQTTLRERELEETNNDLLLALNEPDLPPGGQALLMVYYTSNRYDLSLARSEAKYGKNPTYTSRSVDSLTRLNNQIQNLLSATDQMTNCLKDNPSVALQIGSSLAEIGGAFATPLVGLGVYALSNFFKMGVEISRTWPSAQAIYESNKARMPIGLSCGMEALSRQYCKARDAYTLVDLAELGEAPGAGTPEVLPFFFGMDLQDRHLPLFYTWLDKVVNGSDDPADKRQADLLNEQFGRISSAQSSWRAARGILNQAQKDMAASTDKIRYIKSALIDLVYSFFNYHSSGNDPEATSGSMFADLTAKTFISLLLPQAGPPPTTGSFKDYINSIAITPSDLNVIRANLTSLYESRYQEVIRIFNEKVNIDLSTLVREATRKNSNGYSPLDSLRRTLMFLDQYAYENNSNKAKDEFIINALREKLIALYTELIKPDAVNDIPPLIPCPNDPTKMCEDLSPAAKIIVLTKDQFRLENNNVYLPGVLRSLISSDITTRYLAGEGPREIDDLYRIAKEDLYLLLQRSDLTPALIKNDISRGQSLNLANLEQFRTFFSPAIATAMIDLKRSADNYKEPEAGNRGAPNRNMLSQLCLMTLFSGNQWPKEIDPTVCAGTKIISREAKISIEFDQLFPVVNSKPFEERICLYEEFLRADRLANLRVTQPGKKLSSTELENDRDGLLDALLPDLPRN